MTDAEEKIYADGYAQGYEEAMQEIDAIEIRDAIALLKRVKESFELKTLDFDYYLTDHINEWLKSTEKRH